MKLMFSEFKSDYDNYIFPYAIWGFPEGTETPADCFAHGFLPSSVNMDRFYLCRNIRVRLPEFKPSSENRRILRKGEGITVRLIPRDTFDYSDKRRRFFKDYADQRLGEGVMSLERLDRILNSAMTSHLLVFEDQAAEKEVGVVVLYMEPPGMAYYYFAFYDLEYQQRSLGMYMMTRAVAFCQEAGYEFLYLGSCYSRRALYKTQFAGVEFSTGFRWSDNVRELKYLLQRDSGEIDAHLLESPEYLEKFYSGDLTKLRDGESGFRILDR